VKLKDIVKLLGDENLFKTGRLLKFDHLQILNKNELLSTFVY